ncbi:MAG: 2-amino-4-hydroxy-6-hydroxymethyldihydropteridine diphosphokinase [Terriglobales bacterium]
MILLRGQFLVAFDAVRTDTTKMRQVAYLSLGSNTGDRAANLRTATAQLRQAESLLAVSSLYETQPVDVLNQPWFLNCVVAIETSKTPRALLTSVLSIESAMGRLRFRDKGPRNIDIDILIFADSVLDEPGLQIPHPAMHERRFVLEPLVEIAPEAFHPVLKKTAQELLAALGPGQTVRRLGQSGE